MRVYALAKQLGMENRDLLPELKRMGITVASHSSVLDDDVVQKVLEKLGPKLKAPGRDAEADAGRGERSKSRLGIRPYSGREGRLDSDGFGGGVFQV